MSQIGALKTKVGEWAEKLSPREKLIVGLMLLVVGVFLFDAILNPVREAFAAQKAQLEKLERHSKDVPFVIERYVRLLDRKRAMDKGFENASETEGTQTYIESLLKDKGIPTDNLRIDDPRPQSVGGKYQQAPYNVSFDVSDVGKLVRFLDNLIDGKQPITINKISLKKPPRGNHLQVNLNLNAIKQLS